MFSIGPTVRSCSADVWSCSADATFLPTEKFVSTLMAPQRSTSSIAFSYRWSVALREPNVDGRADPIRISAISAELVALVTYVFQDSCKLPPSTPGSFAQYVVGTSTQGLLSEEAVSRVEPSFGWV